MNSSNLYVPFTTRESLLNAINVRIELGDIADDGGYFDVMDVADDLAELESRGKLERVPAEDWGGSEPTRTLLPYRPS
jgi:hypothetical protein